MASFGETLRRERELRGITLREIAEATKISVRFLHALEEGRVDVLPGGLFPRAFVRQYALHVGLDPERTVAEFLFTHGESAPPARALSPPPRGASRPGLAALVAVAVLALGLVALREVRQPPPPPPATAANVRATSAPPVTLPTDRVYPPPAPSAGPAAAPAAGMVLALQARQNCWVAVEADGVRVLDRVLAEGESQTLNARSEIVLSVGNAGGIAIQLNGRPGVALGREGEVRRNIVITPQSLPSLQAQTIAIDPRS